MHLKHNNRAQGGVRFQYGLFNGMLFKDFVFNGFTIEYNYYHMRKPTAGSTATVALKLIVRSPSQFLTTTYIWEPANNGAVPFRTWTGVSINQDSGANTTWPGVGGGSGWWTSGGNALWGSTPTPSTPQINFKRSLWRYVYSLVNSSKPAIKDAIITYIQMGVGTGTANSTTLFDKLRVTSGSYDYIWYF